MKILMFAPNFYPHIGGVEKHIMKVSDELIKKGHEVTVITVKGDMNLLDYEEINKIKIYRISNKLLPRIWLWIFQHNHLIKESQIIHCHDYFSFIFWYFPFKLLYRQKRTFITFHGFEGRVPIQIRAILLRKISEKFSCGNICIGHYIQKWYHTKPTYVSYGGVDSPQNLSQSAEADKNEAVFVGRLENDTGIMHYLQAILILRVNFGIEMKLNICGDGSLRSIVEEFIYNNDLNVELYGFIDDTAPILNKCKFAFVSGFLAILEALSSGKLVFSTYDNEIKKDYLTMMPSSDQIMTIAASADELAYSIQRCIDNPKDSDAIIQLGYDFAMRFTWENVSNIYLRLWSKEGLGE